MRRNRLLYFKDKAINNIDHHFLLLHHFNSTSGEVFNSKDEALYSYKHNKYSLLGFLDDRYKISDRFIFLLEYPEGNCGYYFEQSKNPLEAKDDENVHMINRGLMCDGTIEFSGLTLFSDPTVTLLN